jgi:hypothetical protein
MVFDAPLTQPEDDCEITRLEHMGRYVTPSNAIRFQETVTSVSLPNMIDTTRWTIDALYVLLSVCQNSGRVISLKYGSKTFTPVIYSNGSLFASLLESIVTGDL